MYVPVRHFTKQNLGVKFYSSLAFSTFGILKGSILISCFSPRLPNVEQKKDNSKNDHKPFLDSLLSEGYPFYLGQNTII